MASLPERRCEKGLDCYHVRKLGESEPAKLRSSNKDGICDKCAQEERDAVFEDAQRLPSVRYEPVWNAGRHPLKVRLELLKRGMVAQMLGMPGRYQEAVQEVRAWWQIDTPPTRLPPPCAEGHYPDPPGLDEQTDVKEFYAAMLSNHPHLLPSEPLAAYDNLLQRWELDLRHALFLGGVSEEHVYRSDTRLLLPWLRFAGACVLFDPPAERAPAFAEYGGLPALPGEEAEGEPLLGAHTERQRREAGKYARVHEATEKFIHEKMWELRAELPDDYARAHYEVMGRHLAKLIELQDRVLEDFEQDMKDDPPPHVWHITYDPKVGKSRDVLRTLEAIQGREGHPPKTGPSLKPPKPARGDRLLPVMCARLLERPGSTTGWLAEELQLSRRRIEQLRDQGRRLLKA